MLLPVLLHRLLRRVDVLAARKVARILDLVLRVLLVDVQLQTVVLGERFAAGRAECRFETLVHPHVALEARFAAELFVTLRTGINLLLAVVHRFGLGALLLLIFPPTGNRSFVLRFTLAAGIRAGISLERIVILGVLFFFSRILSVIFRQVVVREIKLLNLQRVDVWLALQVHDISLVWFNFLFNSR